METTVETNFTAEEVRYISDLISFAIDLGFFDEFEDVNLDIHNSVFTKLGLNNLLEDVSE